MAHHATLRKLVVTSTAPRFPTVRKAIRMRLRPRAARSGWWPWTTIPAVALCASLVFAVVVPVFYQTASPGGELDSVALWVAPDPTASRLFVTDKSGNSLVVFDPVTNTPLGRLGSAGSGPAQFRRPNGVAVSRAFDIGNGLTDILFVVERDNERVSMFSLPDAAYRGAFGAGQLDSPYGIALAVESGQLFAWITSVGASRVDAYRITPAGTGLAGVLDHSFPVSGTLESIAVDSVSGRVLVCDEGSSHRDIMVFDYAGSFLQRFGAGHFTQEPEGIAIYDTGSGGGYVIVSDQYASPTEFEVFDRTSYAWLGHFTGTTTGTDGITIVQLPLPNLPEGSFFAVHSDDRVHCYRWRDIANALGLEVVVQDPDPTTDAESDAPVATLRLECAPNPFNPTTRITYTLPAAAHVDVGLFDVAGRRRATIARGARAGGVHVLDWIAVDNAGQKLPGGVYLCQIIAANARRTLKLVVVQ
jgi:3-phytase